MFGGLKKMSGKGALAKFALLAAMAASLPAAGEKTDTLAFVSAPYALADETAAMAGNQLESDALLTSVGFSSASAPVSYASNDAAPAADSSDGSQIMGINIKWLTEDSKRDNEGNVVTTTDERLFLATSSNAEMAMTFQIEVEFSGQYDYKPGDIRITIPAQVWHARNLTADENGLMVGSANPNLMIGEMDLPVPAAPSTKADFNWQLIDGNYVLTNTCTVGATSSYTFKIAIRDLLPMDIVDMSVSDPISAHVEVVTNRGNIIERSSNSIDAQVDTIAEITDAHKTGEVFEEYYNGMLTTSQLANLPAGTNPEDYIYVRWTSYHFRTNNQPFSLEIEDTISEAYEMVDGRRQYVTDGIFLGANGGVGTVSNNNTHYEAEITDYSATSADGVMYGEAVYMWSAYRKDAFEVPSAREDQKVYYFDNHVEWTLTETDRESGNDERKVTSETADASVLYSPVAWARPVGNFGVDKWTESLRSKDWLYGYALNRIDQGETADMNFIVRTTGYGYPWTSDETRGFTFEELSNAAANGALDQLDLNPDSFGRLGWKQVTEDFDTFFNFENAALTGEDFEFKSLEIYEPYKMRFGKDRAGRWDYIADDTLPNPDLKIEYKIEGDDQWHQAATATWGISGRGMLNFVDVGEGVVAYGSTVIFPRNTTDIRHTFVSNVYGGNMAAKCDTAMIRWDVYPTISLKPSERIKGIVEDLFEANDLPETKFKNDVTMDAYGWVGADGVGELAYGNDFDYSRATLAGAGYGVWLEKSVDYNPENVTAGGDNDVVRQQVTLHYKGVLTEQSTLKDRTDYEEAVKAGVIPAETSGVFYDLLPENIVPKLDSVKLRPGDTITNMYTVPNYKGTNRILLVVEADLTPVPVYDARTMAGYSDQPQITFDAIYSWRDLDTNEAKNVTNYMAFESTVDGLHEGTLGSISGQIGEPDDPTAGNNSTTPKMPEDIADAFTGLNPNSNPNDNRFVYGKVDVGINVVTYTASNLDKMVSDDLVGIWTQGLDGQEQVSVYEGLGYTYRLRVTSSVRATKDIVIFDSLENYYPDAKDPNKAEDNQHVEDRKDWLGAWEGKGQWRGTLKAVDLSDFIAAGVAPKLFYCVNQPGPVFPDTSVDSTGNSWAGLDVFNLNNTAVWQEAQLDENGCWTVPAGVNVTGVALEATKTPTGEDFILQPNHSMSAYLKMIAPDDNEDEDTYIAKGAYARSSNTGDAPVIDWEAATDPANNMYAYNNTYLRHRQSDETGEQWNEELRVIYNDYTRVGIMPEIITVQKVWDDNNDHDRMRPESVTITVKRKVLGAAGEAEVVTDANGNPITAVLSEDNDWKEAFEQLDVVNQDGVRYIYSFEEAPVEGYTSKVEFISSNAYRMINVHPKETISIEGVKTWDDSDNALGFRPDSIVLNLYCDGKYVESKTVYPDADGDWSYAFKDLEKYAEGRVEHVYTIEEDYVPKYELDDSDLAALKNIYNPFGNLEVLKNVNNATEASSNRKFAFTLSLISEATEQNPVAAPIADSFDYAILERDGSGWKEIETGKITSGDTFSITAAQKLVVYDLPSESTYRVTESEAAGFISTSVNAYGQIKAGRSEQAVFTNVYSASGYTAFNAVKNLTGREMMNRQFSFQMIDKTEGSENYGDVISSVRNEEPSELLEEGKQIGSTAEVLFGSIFYTEADHGKTFTYEVKEVIEDKAGYAFDETVYTVNVTVTDNGDGTLNIEKEILKDGAAAEKIEFVNVYEAEGNLHLDAAKVLHGSRLKADAFEFNLYESDAQGTQGKLIDTAKNAAGGEVVFDVISFTQADVSFDPDQPKLFYYLITETKGTDSAIAYSTHKYVVTVRVVDNGDGTLSFAIDNQVVALPDDTCPDCEGAGRILEEKIFADDYVFEWTTKNGADIHVITIRMSGGNEWQKVPVFPDDMIRLKLCEACRGLAADKYGNPCQTCGTSGLAPNQTITSTYMNYDGSYVTDAFVMGSDEVSIAGFDRMFLVGNKDSSTYAIQTNPEYLRAESAECTRCHGTGKIEVTPEISGGVDARVFVNEVIPAGLRAAKLLDGAAPQDGVFEFTLTDKATNRLIETKSTVNGEVVFTPINYTQAGEYTYIIAEKKGNNADITYDETKYEVVVKVTYQDGAYVAEYVYPNNQVPVFKNISKPGALKISKTVAGATDASEDQAFTVELTFTNYDFKPWSGTVKVGGEDAAVVNGSLIVSTLTAEAPVEITGIPAGVKFSAKETGNYPGWTLDADVVDGKIASGVMAQVEFQNTYAAKGGAVIELNKVLSGRVLEDGEFTFQLKDAQGNVVEEVTNDADGVVRFAQLSFAKEGAYFYTVVEKAGMDNTVDYSDEVINVEITMTDLEGEGRLTASLKYSDDEKTFDNLVNPGSLQIRKTAVSTYQGHAQQDFEFVISLVDEDDRPLNGEYDMWVGNVKHTLVVAEGKAEIALKGGDSVTINGLPHGAKYSVVETAVDGFVQKSEGADGVIVQGETAVAAFTNTYHAKGEYTFSAQKNYDGAELQKDQFAFALADEDGVIEIVTNDENGVVDFGTLFFNGSDAGKKVYTVYEMAGDDERILYDSRVYVVTLTITDQGDGTLLIEDDLQGEAILFENKFWPTAEVVFEGNKTLTGREMNENDVFTFEIWEGEELVQRVTNSADGTINYEPIVYTIDDLGKHTYIVSEVAADGNGIICDTNEYTVTVNVVQNADGSLSVEASENHNDLDFVNTYNLQVSAQVEAIKYVNNVIDANFVNKFTFVLEDASGNVIENKKNAADGTVKFSPIVFTEEAFADVLPAEDGTREVTFRYTLYEKDEALNGFSYDRAVYNVFVVLTDDGNGNATAVTKYFKVTPQETSGEYQATTTIPAFYNIYTAEGKTQFSGTKTLTGKALKADDFSFQLIGADGNVIETVKNDKDGKFAFSAIKYDLDDAGKTFTYTVKEKAGDMAGVTYDDKVYEIEVTVVDNGDGTLSLTTTKDINTFNFTNVYEAEGKTQFSGSKILENKELKAEMFSFQLIGADGKVIETVKNGADGKFAFSAITYTLADVGEHKYRVEEVIPEETKGVNYDRTVYDVTVNVVDNGDGTLTAAASEYATELVFINEYETNDAEVRFSGSKILENKMLEAEMFSFQLIGEDGKVIETVKNGADGKFAFSAITYTLADVGEHKYRVEEVIPEETKGVNYDRTVYDVTVNVEDNGEGTLTATASEYATELVFINEYETNDAEVRFSGSKILENKMLEAEMFSFQLIGADGKVIETVKNDKDGKFVFSKITYKLSDVGEHKYRVEEVIPEETKGVNYDRTVYDVTVNVVDNGDGTLTATASEYATELVFINEYETNDAEVQFSGSKILENKMLEAEMFSFQLIGADGKVIETVKNDKDGKFAFSKITYKLSDVGEHKYRVEEVIPEETKGVNYDRTVYDVIVNVVDNGDGILTATASEYATELVFINEYETNDAEVRFSGSKILENKTLEAEMFSFQLIGADGNAIETVKNDKDGKFAFSKLTYTLADVGEYEYTVKEVIPEETNGVTYDETVYTVTVKVEDGGNGELKITKSENWNKLNFTNSYNTADEEVQFSGSKTLTGKALEAEAFSFELIGEDGKVIETVKNDKDGKFAFRAITYTLSDVGEYEYTVKEVIPEETNGVTYDETVYTVTVKVEDGGDGELKITKSENWNKLNFTNSYNAADEEVQFSGSKTLTGKALTAEAFSFELIGEDGKVIETVKNDKDGKFAFSKITYKLSDVGEYEYTVKEVIPEETNGVTYDETVYTVTVKVEDGGNGELKITKSENWNKLNFTNSYNAADEEVQFSGSKTLTGKALEAEAFSFELIGEDGKVIETVKNDKDGKFAFRAITYTLSDVGEYEYTVKEVIPEETNGVTYDETVYTVTVKVEDGGNGELKITKSENWNKLNFTNSYNAADEEVQFSGSKTLTGKALEAEAFSFELIGEDGKVIETVKNDKDGKFAFRAITYTLSDVGEYEYTVKEVIPEETNGVTYDETVYTVTVKVEDNGNGTLKLTKSENWNKLDFANSYNAADEEVQFSGSKTLTGKALSEYAFSFELIDADGNVIENVKNGADGSFKFGKITYTLDDAGKTFTYTVKEVNDAQGGVTYDETVYTVTVKVEDGGNGELKITKSENWNKLNFTNSYNTADEEVQFSGSKTLTGKALTENAFSFELIGEDGKVIETVKNDKDGKFAFRAITYTLSDVGEYEYTVKEVIPEETNGVTYDETVYTVTVKVEDNGNGTLKITKSENWNKLDFANSYNAAEEEVEFSGTKTLTGKALTENAFSFELIGADGKVIETVKNGADGSFKFGKITYTLGDAGKTFTYTVKEVNDAQGGVTYDETVYTVTVKVEDNGNGTLKLTKSENWNKLDFANSYNAAEEEVEFSGTKTLTGKALSENAFSFELVGADGKVIETVKNGADGGFKFGKITYTLGDAGKTFTYTVKEVNDAQGGVTYDETVYTVTVKVEDNGDGTLKLTKSENWNKLDFANSYNAAEEEVEFSGTKTLTGKALTENAFSFELVGADGKVIETVKNGADGSFKFGKITYTLGDAGKTFTYTVKEVNDAQGGVTYDETVYTVTVKVEDNGDGTLKITKSENAEALIFNNSYAAEGSVSFEGSKYLIGREFVETDKFTFIVKENGVVVDTVELIPGSGSSAAIEFAKITYSLEDVGMHTYTVTEVKDDIAGMIYDETTYEVKVRVSDTGNGKLAVLASDNHDSLDFTNKYEAEGELLLTAVKLVNGETPDETQVYEFALVDENGETLQTVTNAGEEIVFDAIKYDLSDAGKTYTYTVVETSESTEDMAADDTVYTVTVEITDNGEGALDIQTVITVAEEVVDEILFNNTTYTKLTISKTVDNVYTEETFEFTVKIYETDGTESERSFPYYGDLEGEIRSGDVIELAHGQSITIDKLVPGMSYKVEEKESLRYTTTVNGVAINSVSDECMADGSNLSFVNSIVTTSLSVKKIWEGYEGGSIVLTLYANGEKLLEQPAYIREGNTYIYENLPMYDEKGNLIVYAVKEKYVDGYMTLYINVAPYEDETDFVYDGGTIINRASTQIRVRKVWSGLAEGETPPQITLTLYCNGEKMSKKTPTPNADGWYVYNNLPLMYRGKKAVYTVVEEYMPGYYTYYTKPDGTEVEYASHGDTIVNVRMPATGDKSSVTAWMAMLMISAVGLMTLMKRRKA